MTIRFVGILKFWALLSLLPTACLADGSIGLPLGLPTPSLPGVSLPGGSPAGGAGGAGGAMGPGAGLPQSGVLNLQALGSNRPSQDGGTSPDAKWGDPLSVDLLGDERVRVGLRYYGEVGATGTTQAVGLKLSIPE